MKSNKDKEKVKNYQRLYYIIAKTLNGPTFQNNESCIEIKKLHYFKIFIKIYLENESK